MPKVSVTIFPLDMAETEIVPGGDGDRPGGRRRCRVGEERRIRPPLQSWSVRPERRRSASGGCRPRRAEPLWRCAEQPSTVTRGARPLRSPPPRPRRTAMPPTTAARTPLDQLGGFRWLGWRSEHPTDACPRFRSLLSSWSQARLVSGGLMAAWGPKTRPGPARAPSQVRTVNPIYSESPDTYPDTAREHIPVAGGAWAELWSAGKRHVEDRSRAMPATSVRRSIRGLAPT